MPNIPNEKREDKKERVARLIRRHPNGISTPEIANTLNIPRRSVNDYVNELEEAYRITKEGKYWLPVNQKPILKFEPEPEEAVVLYLALRMFVKQSDRRNPLAEHLLLKLAQIANTELHLGDDLEQAASELANRPTDSNYEDIFLLVVRAYLYRRKLRIVYHPYRSEPFETTIEPYLIEPSAFGYGMYAIGHSSAPNQRRTYKLERIVEAQLTREPFDIPGDFSGIEILRHAWSIYYGEETVHVVLRFAPEVARRVQESNWRGSDHRLNWDEDNWLRLSFNIADTTDLKPWIRTWGANVEVLEPAYLRDEMTGEARALAHLYGWYTSTTAHIEDETYDDIFED